MEPELEIFRSLAAATGSRTQKAKLAAALIRALGAYRWVGIYDVTELEIAVIAWDGPEAPAHPRFPITKGLNGAAVASKRPVIAQDVAADPRYLTTIGGTRGEMIQPVVGRSGSVVGTIDVESDRVNAFAARDDELLVACASSLLWLWEPSDAVTGR
jgi:L-methionine (R)-S-oxide reductase